MSGHEPLRSPPSADPPTPPAPGGAPFPAPAAHNGDEPAVSPAEVPDESLARMGVIFDEAPVGMAQVGLDGRTLRVNGALAAMLGYTREELQALSFRDVTHPDDLPADAAAYAAVVERREPSFSVEKRYRRKDGALVWARLTLSAVRDAHGRAELLVGIVEDVTPHKRAAERLRVLADAGKALAASLEVPRTLDALAHLALPGFADWCTVDLLDGEGGFSRRVGAHVVPGKAAVMAESARRFPRSAEQADPAVAAALLAGNGLLYPEIGPEMVAKIAVDPEHRALVERIGTRSALAVPLVVGDRLLGVLAFGISESDRRYDAEDLAAAEELGRRAALALEGARLFQAAREAGRRTERLQEITAALSRAATVEEVARVVIDQGIVALGAHAGGVSVLSDDGRELVTLGTVGYDDPGVARFARFPVDLPFPARDVVRTGEAVYVASAAEWTERYGAGLRTVPASEAAAALPLRGAGDVFGVLALRFPDARSFAPADRALLEALATLCAQALERARLYERELRARGEAERAAGATARLQALTAALVGAVDEEGVAAVVLEQGLPAFGAEGGTVLRLDEGGETLEVVASAGLAARVTATWRRYPVELGTPVGEIARSGAPVFLEDFAAWDARFPRHAEMLRGVGMEGFAGLPLKVEGQTIGVLALSGAGPWRLGGDERRLLKAFADQCALALERARLYDGEAAARRRAEDETRRVAHLQALTAALAGAVTRLDVADVALGLARRFFGAAGGLVNVLSDDGADLINLRSAGFADGDLSPWRRYPLRSGTSGEEAVRTGEPVVVRTLEEAERRFPVLAPVLRERGYASFATLPLKTEGRVIGLVAFNFAGEHHFAPGELALMETFATQCALAMERARLYESERRARAEAEEANQAKMQFLATMSHELRTPLNAIAGYVELLEMGIHGPVTDAQRQALLRVQRSQRHLLSLINDVLNFARIEAGHVELHPAPVPLGELLTGLEPLVEPQLGARRLRFTVVERDAGVVALADAEKARQVILNLLSNAIKYTPADGAVSVECAAEGGVARVRVRDTGVGIAPDKLEHVFEPFVQVGRSLTSGHEGTGLGLAISRDLARAMGGDLTAESEPGAGSTFTLTLPLAASSDGEGDRGSVD